jgi:hypothetical protein
LSSGITQAGQYLVIYGQFASSGNQVTIGVVNPIVTPGSNGAPLYNMDYESPTQINIKLDPMITLGSSVPVTITSPNGTKDTVNVSIQK